MVWHVLGVPGTGEFILKKTTFVYVYPPGGRNYYRNRIFWYISFNEINTEFGYFFFIKVLMLA